MRILSRQEDWRSESMMSSGITTKLLEDKLDKIIEILLEMKKQLEMIKKG